MTIQRVHQSKILSAITKISCTIVTTGNIASFNSTSNSYDGVTMVAGFRILVNAQSNQTQNGIYRVVTVGSGSNGVWVRDHDFLSGSLVDPGTTVYIERGSSAEKIFYLPSSTGKLTVGTSNILFTELVTSGGGGGGGGTSEGTVVSVSSDYTLINSVQFVLASGITTITLPSVSVTRKFFTIKNVGTDMITIIGVSGQTIDGNETFILEQPNSAIGLVSDGSNWRIL